MPSVTPKAAATQMVEFLTSLKSTNIIILFHGEDEKCLFPFLKLQGQYDEFKRMISIIVDTRGFFETVQRGRKTGMQTLIDEYGSPEEKQIYLKGAHSALVDATLLSKICGVFRKDFTEWLGADKLLRICSGKKLEKRFSDWLVWEKLSKM